MWTVKVRNLFFPSVLEIKREKILYFILCFVCLLWKVASYFLTYTLSGFDFEVFWRSTCECLFISWGFLDEIWRMLLFWEIFKMSIYIQKILNSFEDITQKIRGQILIIFYVRIIKMCPKNVKFEYKFSLNEMVSGIFLTLIYQNIKFS